MAFRLSGPHSATATTPAPGPLLALVDARETVALFAGAAVLVERDGRIESANGEARPLCEALARETASGGNGPFLRLLRQAAMLARPIAGRLTIQREDDPAGGPRTFDLTILPCRAAEAQLPMLLVTGSETTLERNLRQALIASRDLFRDLVSCSADFAWETDASGVFSFVSARGAVGYSADALTGRPSHSLIDLEQSPRFAGAQARTPFTAAEPMEDIELWLKGAHGDSQCYLLSAIPVHDAGGRWRGARGVGRDITALRRREAELARARAREEVSRAIVEAMLSEPTFNDMLSAATRAIALATKSDRAWVLCHDGQGQYDVGAAFGMMPHGARHFLPPTIALPVLGADGAVEFEAEGWTFLGARTELRGAVNGGLCIARPRATQPFDDDTRALIELLARHTAVAIAQASQLKTLMDLSLSDELTGLGNRRSLAEHLERWQEQGAPRQARAALILIDLDDFKQVNDTAGHVAGDQLLRTFANLLTRDSRKRDLAVRLGGDEFALFIEGISPKDALGRAQRLIRAANDIPTGPAGGRLRLSIGIASVLAAESISLEDIVARADAALYQAKNQGKGQAVLEDAEAGPVEEAR